MSSYEEVGELLCRFDEIHQLVKTREQRVKRFLSKLEDQLHCFHLHEQILSDCEFIVVGSTTEGTAVRDGVDFDVILSLSQPFTMDHFGVEDVTDVGVTGIYKLRQHSDENNNSNSSSCSSSNFNGYANRNGYLKVSLLKEAIFDELEHAVKQIAQLEPDVNFTIKRKNSSFWISVQSMSSSPFKIDLIPQIKGSQWDFKADWNYDVPYVVKSYIRKYKEHTHFNLSFPFWLDEENYSHLAVYATFSQLEGYCMRASDNVRNAVRLTKAVSKHYGWVENGLHSFHIKRTAISLFNALKKMDPWNGHQAILSELKAQLGNGVIWGVFLKNHNIVLKNTNKCLQLVDQINYAKQNISPSNILNVLSEYV